MTPDSRTVSMHVLLLLAVSACIAAPAQDLQMIDSCVHRAIAAYAKIDSYTCRFDKKELINGKYIEQKNVVFKFRKPASVYMKWTEGPAKGFETLYCRGKFNDRIIVHPNGIWRFITLSVDPDGPKARKNNRHSIKEAGLGYVIELMHKNYSRARNDSACAHAVLPDTIIKGRKAAHIRAAFPRDKGYYSHGSDIYFDRETGLPIRIVTCGWRGEIVEEYLFHGMNINPGLQDSDFDMSNKGYGFNGPLFNY